MGIYTSGILFRSARVSNPGLLEGQTRWLAGGLKINSNLSHERTTTLHCVSECHSHNALHDQSSHELDKVASGYLATHQVSLLANTRAHCCIQGRRVGGWKHSVEGTHGYLQAHRVKVGPGEGRERPAVEPG
jgi:hypothetical protein